VNEKFGSDPADHDLERQQTSPRDLQQTLVTHRKPRPVPHSKIPWHLCYRRGLTRGAYKRAKLVN